MNLATAISRSKRFIIILITIIFGTSPFFSQNVNIPDTAFLNALIEEGVDTNEDGEISYAEAEVITYLDVGGESGESFSGMLMCSEVGDIKSLQGIEAFTNLDTLFCQCNLIESLDLSLNTSLAFLECGGNSLDSLDVTNNSALTYLHCGDDPEISELTSLNVSGCTALEWLQCVGNQLTSLNVSGCTALESVRCNRNQLASLDVTNNTSLLMLECFLNQLTSLDVSGCTALEYLNFGSNQLASLDVSKNTSLNSLCCGDNLLTALDVSANIGLTGLYLSNMPSLHEVCVWTTPFPLWAVEVDTTGSPNVYFTTECTTGIFQEKNTELRIYPNPFTDYTTISFSNVMVVKKIELINIHGSILKTIINENNNFITIHRENLPGGIYFIRIYSDRIFLKKLIIL